MISEALGAVAATSARDAWAVGSWSKPHTSQGGSLILHWNGTSWKQVPSPAKAALVDVAAISASDAWIVGYDYAGPYGAARGVILHWNGSSWKSVPCPYPPGAGAGGGAGVGLGSVVALSARSAWAVGSYGASPLYPNAFIVHWNGTKWSQAHLPPLNNTWLTDVAALSAGSVWAVSQMFDGPNLGMTLRWNGTSWKQVASPDPTAAEDLFGVGASTAGGLWVVGQGQAGPTAQPLAAHWNGTKWHVTPVPAAAGNLGETLTAVASISPDNAWADGSFVDSRNKGHPVLVHWNGTAWQQSPNPAPTLSGLADIAAVSATDIWAVGQTGAYYRTAVILHWNGTKWTQVSA